MSKTELRLIILQAIRQIAPESDAEHIDPNIPFRDQFDFDSVDFVNLVELLQKALQRKIPEIDYPCLATLNGCLAYLS